jgi:hypothetical protein
VYERDGNEYKGYFNGHSKGPITKQLRLRQSIHSANSSFHRLILGYKMTLSDFTVVLEKLPLIPRERLTVSFQRLFYISLYSVIVACAWGVVVSLFA